jgi:hypothetical protein
MSVGERLSETADDSYPDGSVFRRRKARSAIADVKHDGRPVQFVEGNDARDTRLQPDWIGTARRGATGPAVAASYVEGVRAMPVSGELQRLCSMVDSCRVDVLESVLTLAHEMAQEGGEDRRVGALFTVGRASDVLRRSRPLILDPLCGPAPTTTHIADPDLRGTLKVLAQLDGAGSNTPARRPG